MPYSISYSPTIPSISNPTVIETIYNPTDNSIIKTPNIPAIANPIVIETIYNPADNLIAYDWEVPFNAVVNTLENAYFVDVTGNYNARATQNVYPGQFSQRHIYPDRVWHRARTLVWKFKLVDATNKATPEPGIAVAGITVKYCTDLMSAFVTISPTKPSVPPGGDPVDNPVVEIGDGWYSVDVPIAGSDGNTFVLMSTAAGCTQCDELIQIYRDDSKIITKTGKISWADLGEMTWADLGEMTWADINKGGISLPVVAEPITIEDVDIVIL
jgi:hypothetical protein